MPGGRSFAPRIIGPRTSYFTLGAFFRVGAEAGPLTWRLEGRLLPGYDPQARVLTERIRCQLRRGGTLRFATCYGQAAMLMQGAPARPRSRPRPFSLLADLQPTC